MKNKKNYPKIKYRLVTGNGPSTYYNLESVQNKIQEYQTNPIFKNNEKFKPQYIIKITEELIEL